MQEISFIAGGETVELIEELKTELGASSDADVFRKALALAKVAVEQARGSKGVVVIRGKNSRRGIPVALSA